MVEADSPEFAIESAIIRELVQVDTCSFYELAAQLPGYSWVQVFSAVDRLSREGSVTLHRSLSSSYILSLAP